MAEVQAILGGDNFMFERVDYTKADSSGVVVTIVVSWFSGTAVLGLLAALGMSAWNTRRSVNPHLFVRSHVAAYFISLLWCDLIQAFGSILNVRWVSMKAVEYGHYCAFQGFIKQSADVSIGIWSMLISLHTFLVVFLRWNMPKRSLFAFFIGGWGFVLLMVIIGNAGYRKADGPFYGIAGYYCWISSNYGDERVTLDYLWLFLSAGVSFVLYALVYLNLRGNVTKKGVHLRRDSTIVKEIDDQSVAIAKQMLIYPIAFTILIFPIAICRFIEWSGHAVSDAASSFSDSVYLMAGLVDVTLFVLTRRVLPEHSVFPRSVNLKLCLRRKGSPQSSGNSTPNASAEVPDPEKGNVEKYDVNGSPIHVELAPGVFKRADSPDSEHESDSEVTIRVQSVVVDRIYMQPDAHADPRTPPGLTPDAERQMEDVPLDSARGVRQVSRESSFYGAKDLPPAPTSARSALNMDRGSTLDGTRGTSFYAPGSAPLPVVRSPRGTFYSEQIPSPAQTPRGNYGTEEVTTPVRSARDDYYAQQPSGLSRSARDNYYADEPLRSARHFSSGDAPSSARGSRDDCYAQDTVASARSARGNYLSEEPASPLRSARGNDHPEDASALRSPRRSMSEGVPRHSRYAEDDEPYLSSLHTPHSARTDSSHYTEEAEDDAAPLPNPNPIHTPRTAPLPLYLGTPQSASFALNRRVPASAREMTFPMSARLPPSSGNWS